MAVDVSSTTRDARAAGSHAALYGVASFDAPTPSVAVDVLLHRHCHLIDRIQLAFGLDRAAFEQSVLTLIHRYAAFVHLLPCTADNYFAAPGDLLRIGLEAAFFALQGTDAHIFSGRATIAERRKLEPRWRLATFIAGLCAEVHRPLSHMIVVDAAHGQWSPFLQPLADWLAARRAEHYFLRWRADAQESQALALYALPHIAPGSVLEDLSAAGPQIIPHLLAAVSGVPGYREHNVLDALVRRSLALVIDRNLQDRRERTGRNLRGSHVPQYLLNVLRGLVADNPNWVPNAEKSRFRHGADGAFLVWPAAAEDMRRVLEANQIPGLPETNEAILDALLADGLLVARENGAALWPIEPPGAKGVIQAVRLRSVAALYGDASRLPTPLAVALVKSSPSSTDAPPVQPPPAAQPDTSSRQAPSDEPAAKAPDLQAQRDWLDEDLEEAPVPSPREAPEPQAVPLSVAKTRLGLRAPMRLSPAVKQILESIVANVDLEQGNLGPAGGVALFAEGLFIPLSHLAGHGVAAPAAVRSLSESTMLASSATVMRTHSGQSVPGLLLASRHLDGLPLNLPSWAEDDAGARL